MNELQRIMSVNQLLSAAVESVPDQEAIVDGNTRVTYRELDKKVNQLAFGLVKLGIGKGDSIAVCLPNWYETIVIYFAATKIGANIVPFDTRFGQKKAEYILQNSGAKILFFSEEFDHVNFYEQTILSGRLPSLQFLVSVRFDIGSTINYETLLESGKLGEIFRNESEKDEEINNIFYSTGNKEKPKSAIFTQYKIVQRAVHIAEQMKCTNEDVILLPIPLFHLIGINFLFTTTVARAKVILMDKFKPEHALSNIETEGVTVHLGVPTMFLLELNHPSFSSYDISSLRIAGIISSTCPNEVVHRVKTDMNCQTLIGYSLTEPFPVS